MDKLEKKKIKSEIKRSKKLKKSGKILENKESRAVQFAKATKGILYLILAFSLLLAIILGQSGVIMTLEDIISNLIIVWTGKVILFIITLALFIYGLKQMGIMK